MKTRPHLTLMAVYGGLWRFMAVYGGLFGRFWSDLVAFNHVLVGFWSHLVAFHRVGNDVSKVYQRCIKWHDYGTITAGNGTIMTSHDAWFMALYGSQGGH